jgi:hypothetical protein
MPAYSDEVRELVLGTLWSQWAELGVSGWDRHHQDAALDLEALIITTARVGRRDSRLRAEALDWSVAHGRIASAVRLKHLTAGADTSAQGAIREFTATVNANSALRWPGSGSPVAFTSTGKSAEPQLDRPALIQLRLRALWGVSARAEVLRVMLSEGHRFIGISEVAAAAAFGKDAVAEALDNLHRGGLLDEAGARNQRVFRLGRREDLVSLVGREPNWQRSWAWHVVLPIMAGILEATDLSETPSLARAAGIQRRWREWQPTFARLGIITGALRTGLDFLHDYQAITMRALRVWSGVDQSASAAHDRHGEPLI